MMVSVIYLGTPGMIFMGGIKFNDSNSAAGFGKVFNKATTEKAESKVEEPAKPAEPKEFEEDD
jgi:hypothetical protein